MAAFEFNVSLGREVEFYNRVNSNDPANAALLMVVLAETGLELDSVLRDKDTLADVLSGTTNEVTNGSYARKVLTDVELANYVVDDNANSITLVLPSQTFTAIAAGDSWRKVLICYDGDTTAGTDTDIIPITAHDLLINNAAIVPAADNIVVDFSAGFVVAS